MIDGRPIVVAVALAILASCGSQPGGNEAAADANQGAAPADEAAASDNSSGGKPPIDAAAAEPFVGRWSVDGNCAHFMILGRDGSYLDYNETRGTWRPAGEHIEVYLGEQPMIVERISLMRC
jgi:hypothetical protein